jgi:hypothetical protein
MQGVLIIPTDSQRLFMAVIAKELENEEILRFLETAESQPSQITMANFESRIDRRVQLGLDIEPEISFAATHFLDLSSETFQHLGVEIGAMILYHPNLSIDSEDSLLNFILNLPETFRTLLEYVECRFLSRDGIDRFIREVKYDVITEGIWDTMCRRALMDPSLPRSRQFVREQHFDFNGDPFSGIIAALRAEGKGRNPHVIGQVEVKASSTAANAPWQVLDYGWENHWYSQNERDSWIQIDFKKYRVSLSNYTVKLLDMGGNRFQNWVIEGSNDESRWFVLDSEKIDDLGPSKFATLPVKNQEYYRFVRMRHTGKTQLGQDRLVLTNIEVFGRIRCHVESEV